jgi:YHS domain-containing protein
MAIDPVCGMKVKEDTPLKTSYKGKTYYFCNETCKDTFEKNPLKYTR